MFPSLLRVSVVALGALVVSPVLAQEAITARPADTAELASLCSTSDLGFCYGYLTSAAQFYGMLVTDAELDIKPFLCPGRPVPQSEARTIFLDWFSVNADRAKELPLDGLFRAWTTAFPCP